MNSIQTRLQEVTKTPRSTALAADADADATEILVTDTGVLGLDAGELGGLELGGTDYIYTAVDETTGTITLHEDTPLLEDAAAGDAVQLLTAAGEPAQKWLAWVIMDDGDQAIPVTIGGDWLDKFREGTSQAGMTVAIEEDGSGYRVAGQPESPPVASAEFIDPDTLPDTGGGVPPTEPPSEIVTLKVVGDATGLNIYADGDIAASTTLDYYIDGVLFDNTQSRVVRRENDSTGAPMVDADPGTTWSIHVVPRNVIDEGTPSDPVVAGLNPGITSEILAQLVATIRLVADAVEVGAGSWTEENGLHIPIAAGGGLFHVPNNGDPIQMLGVVLQAAAAVFTGNVVLQGETTLEGSQTAAVGVTKPAAAPAVSEDWPTPVQLEPHGTAGATAYGIYLTATHLYRCVSHSSSNNRIYEFDRTTGEITNTIFLSSLIPTSLTQVDGNWIVVTKIGASRAFRVYDSSWNFVDAKLLALTGTSPTDPIISANGTSTTTVRITYSTTVSGTPRFHSQAYTIATGATSGAALTVDTSGKYDIYGVYYGAADFGATRLVIDSSYSGGVRVYDTSGTGQEHFTAISNHRGIAWDSSFFYSLDTSSRLYRYSDVIIGDSPVATYTRRDSTDGWETEASPPVTFARAARRHMKITTPATDAEADAVGVFVDNHRQTNPAAGVTTVLIGKPTTGGAAAPTTNTFPDDPGVFQSEADDGAATPAKLTKFDGAGAARAAKLIQAGTHTFTAVTTTTQSFPVVFDVPFDTVPIIARPNPRTTAPDLFDTSASNITETGFDLKVKRTTGSQDITVGWIATTGH